MKVERQLFGTEEEDCRERKRDGTWGEEPIITGYHKNAIMKFITLYANLTKRPK